jgi:hypothetical protein
MRFLVSRASQGSVSAEPPCKNAIRGPEAAAWPGEYEWLVDLNTLDDLLAFLQETGGGLGVFAPEEGNDHLAIEVFDDDQDEV